MKKLLAALLLTVPTVTLGQSGLQGPFIPIEPSGPSTTSGGTTTVPFMWRATDTNGQPVYTNAPVSMTTADVANGMRTNVNNTGNPQHCTILEGMGYICSSGPPPEVTTDPGDNPPEYDQQSFCGLDTGQPYSFAECAALWEDYMENVYGGSAVVHPTDPYRCATSTRVDFWTNTGVFTYWRYDEGGAWPPCSDYIGPIDAPIDPGDGTPLDDEQLKNIGTDPSNTNNFVDNRRFYTNNTNSSINTNNSYFSSTQTTITNNYSTETGTTAGTSEMPEGYASDPADLGMGEPGTNSPGSGNDGSGGGTGSGSGTGDVNVEVDVQVDVPDFCDENPNRTGCLDASLGSIPAPDAIDESDYDVGTLTPVAIAGGGGCPAPVSLNTSKGNFTFNKQPICDTMTAINPVVQAVFALGAMYILVGWKR